MKNRAYLSGLGLFVVGVVALAVALVDDSGASGQGAGRAGRLAKQLGPGVSVAFHRQTGDVRFIGTAPGRPIARPSGLPASVPPVVAARAFLDARGRAFGLERGSRSLRVAAVDTAPGGGAAVRFRQEIDSVPVLAGELVVGVDEQGRIRSVLGEVEPDPTDTSADIGGGEARKIAISALKKDRPELAPRLRATEPRLAIYDSRLLGGPGLDLPVLVWQVEVFSPGSDLRRLVLVDAHLGVVAETIDQIESAKDRRVCDAEKSSERYPCESPYEREEGDPATGIADIDLAYEFAGDTYDFFSGRFGRDSLDGAGLPLVSTVRYCEEKCPYKNAFWDGSQMVYGTDFSAADDVVGHELGHGFTQFTSNLFYWYQSGAINESMSDVFGEYMDLTNGAGTDTLSVRWLIGEDIPKIGALRDMRDPPEFSDPDRMTSSLYAADADQADEGGVHTNSGVGNKAAYLIADGETFNGETVTGIGIDKAARVYFEAESTLLTSGSDYADLYEALQQACTNAIGGEEGIGVADCEEVTDAVDATEMDQQPANGPAPEAPVCGSGQTVDDLFLDDLENTASGNWAHSAQTGTDGWYYPQNSHPFSGFDATYATSGTTNFWGYDRPAVGEYSIAQSTDTQIPAGVAYLRFNHSYAFEDGSDNGARYDGGQLQYSTDGGSTWHDAGPLFTHNGYNGIINSNFKNPLGGAQAFTAESNGYISSRVDLSSLAGEEVRFRFRIGTDEGVDDYGWFIDDVRVYSCEGPGDTEAPDAPTLEETDPASPSNDNEPLLIGSAETASTVRLYDDPSCEGALLASGSAADLESPGLAVSVADNSTTTIHATAEDAAENVSPCSAGIEYVEDSTAPTSPAPESTSHETGAPSNDPTVEVSFEGATDNLSGVDGFSYSWDTSPATTPDTVKDAEEGATEAISPELADGSSHYFHLTTRDNAGNWSAAVHLGPFTIDTEAPDAPTLEETDPASPSNDNEPLLIGSAETASTVRLYDDPSCEGALLVSGSAADLESPGLAVSVADNSTTTIHATAEDAAENVSPCSAGIEYVEDSTAVEAEPAPEPDPGESLAPPAIDPTEGDEPPGELPPAFPRATLLAPVAAVRAGIALVSVGCRSSVTCRGVIRLVALAKRRNRGVRARRVPRRSHRLLVGKRRYSIGARRTAVVRVRLNRRGKRLLRRAGRRGLRVRAQGRGLKGGPLRLKLRERRRRS